MALTFVLGGARSGKSGFARCRQRRRRQKVTARAAVMIVTAQAFDEDARADRATSP